jgi:hypothetical protein
MRVPHRHLDVRVSEQFLHGLDRHAALELSLRGRFFASLKITKTDTISVIAVARLMARLE